MMAHWLLQLVVVVLVDAIENQMGHMMVGVDTQNMVVVHGMVVSHNPKNMIWDIDN